VPHHAIAKILASRSYRFWYFAPSISIINYTTDSRTTDYCLTPLTPNTILTMTGATSVESKFANESIKLLFADKMLAGDEMTQSKKVVWHNFCLAKAGVEVSKGGKMKKSELHIKLQKCYDRWATLICSDDGSEAITFERPSYVTMKMFTTKDFNNLQERANNEKDLSALWRQWTTLKAAIVNFDNNAVRKAIRKMPGKSLPSGTDFSLFFNRLVYEMYTVRSAVARKALGGSVAKALQLDKEVSDDNEDEEDTGEVAESLPADKEENDNDPRAPASYVPPRLLVILALGVLSNATEPALGYVEDDPGGDNMANVPSRKNCRDDGDDEGSRAMVEYVAKGATPAKAAVSRHADRAEYNDIYKEAMSNQVELGEKEVLLKEKELHLREKEVRALTEARTKEAAARDREVSQTNLASLYKDLREELKEAKEDEDSDLVDSIKGQLLRIKKRRLHLEIPN